MGEHCMLRAEERKLVHKPGELGVTFHVAGLMDFDVEVPMPGKFSVYNALAAIAICRHFKVDEENIKKALLHKVRSKEDRIEVVSPGGLPAGITKEEYLSGKLSVLRNRNLANVFYRLGFVEIFGTGIMRIRQLYEKSLRKPEFDR